MSESVVDASAVIAFVRRELGAAVVARAIAAGAAISTVSLAEIVSKLSELGRSEEEVRRVIDGLGLDVVPFDEDHAFRAGGLRTATRSAGLSLGDRACLALAEQPGVPALTTDRSWQQVQMGIEIHIIR